MMRLSHIHSITPIKKILITPKHLGILDTISTNRKIRFNQLILAQYPFCDTHLNNTLAILGIIFRFGLETKKTKHGGYVDPSGNNSGSSSYETLAIHRPATGSRDVLGKFYVPLYTSLYLFLGVQASGYLYV